MVKFCILNPESVYNYLNIMTTNKLTISKFSLATTLLLYSGRVLAASLSEESELLRVLEAEAAARGNNGQGTAIGKELDDNTLEGLSGLHNLEEKIAERNIAKFVLKHNHPCEAAEQLAGIDSELVNQILNKNINDFNCPRRP